MFCCLNVWFDRWLKIFVLFGGFGISNGDIGMGLFWKFVLLIELKNLKVEVVW